MGRFQLRGCGAPVEACGHVRSGGLEVIFFHKQLPPQFNTIANGVKYWEGQRWTGAGTSPACSACHKTTAEVRCHSSCQVEIEGRQLTLPRALCEGVYIQWLSTPAKS